MTKIIFRSAFQYDTILSELAGHKLERDVFKELDVFVSEMQKMWDEYNDIFFSYFESMGITMPAIWNVYPIHSNGKITSFSEPTTLIMKENRDEVIATLVHEVCHVFCGLDQNDVVLSPIWERVSDAYKEEELVVREHIFVNVLARAGLRRIVGQEKAEALLKMEKDYEGLEKAWRIIDGSRSVAYDEPLKFLEELTEEN